MNRHANKTIPASYCSLNHRPRSGFALVIALALMTFIVLLIFSMSALTQVELATASHDRSQQLARENARLGLLVALGQLQKAAGPDQRVTARADILGDTNYDVANQYWTGVWNTTNMNAAPTWLVSGAPNVTTQSNDTALLAGSAFFGNLANRYVRVEREPVRDENDATLGYYAYWVSDEGIKASIAKNSDLERYLDNFNYPLLTPESFDISELELKRLRQISGDRPYFERMFTAVEKIADESGYEEDIWESTTQYTISNVASFSQLGNLTSLNQQTPDQGSAVTELQYNHADLTLNSKGILANTREGGLKKDLSNETITDPDAPFEFNSEFWSFLNARPDNNDRAEFRGVNTGAANSISIDPGDPINPVGPVIVEFALYFGVFRASQTSENLEFHITIGADIWNPYATQMGFTPSGIDDLIFDFEMPTLNLTWVTEVGKDEEDDGAIIFNPNNIDFKRNGETFTLNEVPFDIYDKMAVGEVRKISEKLSGLITIGVIEDAGSNRDAITIQQSTGSTLTLRIKTKSGDLIQEFKDIPFGSFIVSDELRYDSNVGYSDYQAAYHFKFHDEVLSPNNDLEKWMSEFDVRAIIQDFGDSDILDMFEISSDPAFAVNDESIFSGRPEFFVDNNYHRFFDYTGTEPISIGHLQHLQFRDTRPFSIGNPWGGDLNEAFDRYFFSSMTDDHGYGLQLPNHHLSQYTDAGADATNADEAAAAFMVDGAFNLNSTSVKAWEAALGAIHLYDWQFRINEDTSSQTLSHVKNAIFRFPHMADRSYTHPYSNGSARIRSYPEATQSQRENWYRKHWQPDWAAAFTVGARQLRDGDNGDNIDDVKDLAEAIVDKIKAHGKPFDSIEEMLNDGILQEAIDDTRINTVSSSVYKNESNDLKKLPRYCPSFVTQADLINILAPYAQTRSDTFLIRAYGNAENKITGEEEATAWCEAEVQRIPHVGASNDRQFKIISFRWLDETEI
ncbi:pilus assembly PilX family protein [Cerasicoccus frondis]|uniref:pilus assembly PilX family protein n=1 Tax=Cerasicoccus frondis TaxID=490090 RepID=UPI002852B712|nr:hypothetical protein [Cerasicoccus frondis]